MAMTEADGIVNQFMAAWERGDINEMLDHFAEDAIYHPVSFEPAVGKAAIRKLISEWLTFMKVLSAEVHLQVTDGKTVMNERTERYLMNSQEVTTPVASVFEVKGGLITAWREYYDAPKSGASQQPI
jgi:limonene-1,2-epoxide hydrolase